MKYHKDKNDVQFKMLMVTVVLLLQLGGPHLAVWPLTCRLCRQVVALVMDGESDPSPAVAEEAGERVEPMEATPSPQPQSTPASEEPGGEAVSMETEDGATEDNEDDDVVLVGEEASQPAATAPQDTPSADCQEPPAAVDMSAAAMPSLTSDSPGSSNTVVPQTATVAEPIVIDDEEEPESKDASPCSPAPPGGSSPSRSPGALSSTEPDSEIRIASVTTLGSGGQIENPSAPAADADDVQQEDMNLMITSVTSLQGGAAAVTEVSSTRTPCRDCRFSTESSHSFILEFKESLVNHVKDHLIVRWAPFKHVGLNNKEQDR